MDFTEMHFPCAGIDLSRAVWDQQTREIQPGVYSRSTPGAVNVRGYEASALRRRGGTRSGLSKFIDGFVSGERWLVQGLNVIAGTLGDAVQTSNSGRVITAVAVSQGNVYYARAGDTAWSTATNTTGATPPLVQSGLLYSANNNGKVYFADGSNWTLFDPSDGTVNRWVASAGTLPADDMNNTPRLICTYRGRTVVSGLLRQGAAVYFSKVGDPTNWDFFDPDNPPTIAVLVSFGPQGAIGDTVTALIPYSNDRLVIGALNSLYVLAGDPAFGGSVERISDAMGIVGPAAWCKAPDGTLFFVSNRMRVYSFVPGQSLPVPISQQIEKLLLATNTGTNSIHMQWDDGAQGFHLWITLLANPSATTHYFYEARTGAFWTDSHANTDHDPLCSCTFDGNRPEDRCVLIGSWDGYVRKIDPDATDDDGTDIAWDVLAGPLVTKTFDEIMLHELVADIADGSNPVSWAALVGKTAEAALASSAVKSGTWKAGRNTATPVRRSGHAHYVRLSGVGRAAFERVRARVSTLGKVRSRGG